MTSETSCFVYIQLPRSLDVVTCGRFVRESQRGGGVVGRFVYGRSYRGRSDAVPIDPYNLPLSDTTYVTAKLKGVFGAIRDASPDYWGRRVIEKVTNAPELDEIEYLLRASDNRAGALSFGLDPSPPAPNYDFNRIVQLQELMDAAALIEEQRPVPQHMTDLLQPGTSVGGARPKNVVEDEDGLWIAKFPAREDRWNNAAVEAAMLTLAARSGIEVPQFRVQRVGSTDVLLVKRFDRERVERGYFRHRMVSALTVLDSDDNPVDRTNWSYLALADEIQRWSFRPAEDKRELFRRMALNALVSNTDDHPRNHALIAGGTDWQLSPVYDVTPTPAISEERRDLALECGRFGRIARRDNLCSACTRFGLSIDEANSTIDRIKATVAANWEEAIVSNGGSRADIESVRRAFVYSGFELDTER